MPDTLDFVPRMSRRRVLAAMAAAAALGSGCSKPPRERILPWVRMPEMQAAGQPAYYASAFVRDGWAHGVLVGTEDGRPIKIEGNPEHPSSLGATDVFAQASVLQLWDPQRSRTVARQAAGEPASWAAFETTWAQRLQRARAGQGAGLALLTGPVTSPSLLAQVGALLGRFPRATWHVHDPLASDAAREGSVACLGRDLLPVYDFARASCVVSLGADPFSDGPGAVRHAMDWSTRRRRGEAASLFAAEATPGLFGARATHRVALSPPEIDRLVVRIAQALAPGAAAAAGFEGALVRAVQAAGSQALLVPGPHLSAHAAALVHAMNAHLGAAGQTVRYIAPPWHALQPASLPALVDAMQAGAVDTLLVLDANPAYDAPAAFRQALARVPLSVHAGLTRDETGAACTWHLPLAHDYERWGDALAHDGTVTLVQPAIAPLHDARSPNELLALLAGDDTRDGHALVQRHWRQAWGGGFEERWRESLRLGRVEGSAPQPAAAAPKPLAALLATPSAADEPPSLVAVFPPDPSAHDGRFAGNAWLQELPRPFTKYTWDNALLLGPATARGLGVETGDVVRAIANGSQVEAPAWVLAQHAEQTVTVPLGYGRVRAGPVGDGVGFDGYRLKPAAGLRGALKLERTGRRHEFAVTQRTMDQHGRELARTVARGGRIAQPALPSLYPEPPRPEDGSPAWAMTIDLDTCIGCNACTIACQAENNIPVVGREEVARGREMHWIRVDRYETPEAAGSIFQPVPCMHCEKAPCEVVCPVGATMHDTDGLNVQVYNRCIGTRFCSQNCPYKVRRFNFLQYSDSTTETLKGQRNPNVTVRERGVMEKCTYCIQRIARARQHSQATGRPLEDGDVVTACQAVCPARAIHFGDLHQAGGELARDRASPRHYALLHELNTRPRTTYLARLRDGEGGES